MSESAANNGTLSLFSSGSNARGQLATGDTNDAHVFTPCLFHGCLPGQLPDGTTTITDVACGANHTLALLTRYDSQELWGCGDGRRGQLGPSYLDGAESGSGAVTFRPLEIRLEGLSLEVYAPRLVAAAWETSYVVLSCPERSDVLISMGADDFGNLGAGGVKGKTTVGRSLYFVPLLDAFSDVRAGGNVMLSVQALDSGPHHVVAVVKLTSVDGYTTEDIVGWQLSGIGSNRKSQRELLETVRDAIDIACTWNGTYALIRDAVDKVVATGSNNHGQLGRGMSEPSGKPGHVELPSPSASSRVVKIACGSEHVLCLLEVDRDGAVRREVWGWGWNEHGNLGIGSTEDASAPIRMWPPHPADWETRAVGIWGGNGTSWILVKR